MFFVEMRLGIGGVQVDHSHGTVEYFQRHREHTVDAALHNAGGVGERFGGRQVVAQNGDALRKNLGDDGAADLNSLTGARYAIPAEYRGPFIHAVLAQQNGRAIGRRDFEDAFQHLLFERLQPAHRVHRFADSEQGVQIADGAAVGLDILQLLEVARVLFPQDDGGPAARLGLVELHRGGNTFRALGLGQHKDEQRASDLDLVAGGQNALSNGNVIHKGTVTAVQILDLELPIAVEDEAMMARDSGIQQGDKIGRLAPNGNFSFR